MIEISRHETAAEFLETLSPYLYENTIKHTQIIRMLEDPEKYADVFAYSGAK